jgi:hypothetical protein
MSEQQHTDTIKNLLDKYGLAEPAQLNVGVFTNQNLQAAYSTPTSCVPSVIICGPSPVSWRIEE